MESSHNQEIDKFELYRRIKRELFSIMGVLGRQKAKTLFMNSRGGNTEDLNLTLDYVLEKITGSKTDWFTVEKENKVKYPNIEGIELKKKIVEILQDGGFSDLEKILMDNRKAVYIIKMLKVGIEKVPKVKTVSQEEVSNTFSNYLNGILKRAKLQSIQTSDVNFKNAVEDIKAKFLHVVLSDGKIRTKDSVAFERTMQDFLINELKEISSPKNYESASKGGEEPYQASLAQVLEIIEVVKTANQVTKNEPSYIPEPRVSFRDFMKSESEQRTVVEYDKVSEKQKQELDTILISDNIKSGLLDFLSKSGNLTQGVINLLKEEYKKAVGLTFRPTFSLTNLVDGISDPNRERERISEIDRKEDREDKNRF